MTDAVINAPIANNFHERDTKNNNEFTKLPLEISIIHSQISSKIWENGCHILSQNQANYIKLFADFFYMIILLQIAVTLYLFIFQQCTINENSVGNFELHS